MNSRQSPLPTRWLVADERLGSALWPALRRLRCGSGVLVLFLSILPAERRLILNRIRRAVRGRAVVVDGRKAARVHDAAELRAALLAKVPLILLSPLYPTASHRDWPALPRMRAAALARLGRRKLIALGGMNEQRFRRVQRLGFVGWAGMDAFRT